MGLDRELQKSLLTLLSECYPNPMASSDVAFKAFDQQVLPTNLVYLIEHGLVDGFGRNPTVGPPIPPAIKISARGLDFLEQDGGLSAILGTVTVKLHADTIRDLLETKVMASDLPPEDKKRFVDTLKELPGEALKTFTNKLIEMACDNPQAVFTTLTKFIP